MLHAIDIPGVAVRLIRITIFIITVVVQLLRRMQGALARTLEGIDEAREIQAADEIVDVFVALCGITTVRKGYFAYFLEKHFLTCAMWTPTGQGTSLNIVLGMVGAEKVMGSLFKVARLRIHIFVSAKGRANLQARDYPQLREWHKEAAAWIIRVRSEATKLGERLAFPDSDVAPRHSALLASQTFEQKSLCSSMNPIFRPEKPSQLPGALI